MKSLMLLLLASCTHDIVPVDRVDVRGARDLDMLFVFDDSSDRSTFDQMASQLDVLQTRLMDVDGQLPNLHVGVVTTDMGTMGTMDTTQGPRLGNCFGGGKGGRLVTFQAGVPTNRFLEDLRGPDGRRIRNFESDDLMLELGQLTNPDAGTANTGCEFEQPLEAMRRALDPDANPGFIRPEAMLSVVFLTNQDDCSLKRGGMLDPGDDALGPLSSFRCTEQGVICDGDDPRSPGTRTNCRPREGSPFMVDVAEYQAFLETYKPDRRDVVVSAVGGPRTPFEVQDLGSPVLAPSCQGIAGPAKPAVRIGALVDSFGGVVVDSCTQDAAYQKISAPIVNPQRSCLPNLRKADGEDCTVTELAGDKATEIGSCADGSASPCWYTYSDAGACPNGDNLAIAIRRGTTTAPAGSRVEASCAIPER